MTGLRWVELLAAVCMAVGGSGCSVQSKKAVAMSSYVLDFNSPCDGALQAQLEALDSKLRERFGMTTNDTAVGVLDLKHLRLAMLNPDRMEYAASVPKVGILLAWFQMHRGWETNLDTATRHELGLMAKASSNEAASKFSREMGLEAIQRVIESHGLYDAMRGGGIWVGKHYGPGAERVVDPVGNHSHGANVRQLLRFFLLLEQGRLVSSEASQAMREIFASPDIPHDNIKFVKGLAGRNREILRKWGTWQDWRHDAALISGEGRRYILVALTHHAKGDEYLVEVVKEVDDLAGGLNAF